MYLFPDVPHEVYEGHRAASKSEVPGEAKELDPACLSPWPSETLGETKKSEPADVPLLLSVPTAKLDPACLSLLPSAAPGGKSNSNSN